MSEWLLHQQYKYFDEIIHYDVFGEGPPLILVHGTPFSSYIWRNIIPELSKHWMVYVYDLLGYGASEKRVGQDVSLGAQDRVLAALLDHWQLESPAIVGHDLGGTTVLRTLLLQKRNFRRIALIDPVALSPWGSPLVQHVKRHEVAFQDLPPYFHRAIVIAYIQGAIYHQMDEKELAPLVEPWLGSDGQAGFYRQITQMDQRYTDEIELLYGNIQCPVLILWGEQDQWIPLSQGKHLHELLHHSEFLSVPNAGHLVQEDAPEFVTSALIEFFSRNAGRS